MRIAKYTFGVALTRELSSFAMFGLGLRSLLFGGPSRKKLEGGEVGLPRDFNITVKKS